MSCYLGAVGFFFFFFFNWGIEQVALPWLWGMRD